MKGLKTVSFVQSLDLWVEGRVPQMQVPQGTFLPVAYLTGFAFLAGRGKNAAAIYQCVSDSFE